MKKTLILIFFLINTLFIFAQNAEMSSVKLRLNEYGQSTTSSSLEPTIIQLDAQNKKITITTTFSEAQQYLNYQSEFNIIDSKGSRGGAQMFITDDFIITINYRLRSVIVSKKNTNPQISSLWFEEITF